MSFNPAIFVLLISEMYVLRFLDIVDGVIEVIAMVAAVTTVCFLVLETLDIWSEEYLFLIDVACTYSASVAVLLGLDILVFISWGRKLGTIEMIVGECGSLLLAVFVYFNRRRPRKASAKTVSPSRLYDIKNGSAPPRDTSAIPYGGSYSSPPRDT